MDVNSNLAAVVPTIIVLLVFGFLVGIPVAVAWRQVRQDRRKIIAEGVTSQATITKIGPPLRHGQLVLYFTFEPSAAGRLVKGSQRTTKDAIDALRLTVGSGVQVHYLAKWPSWGFIDGLTLRERVPRRSSPGTTEDQPEPPVLYYVSYIPPNSFKWVGNGDLVFCDQLIRLTAQRRRPFWFPTPIHQDFAINSILDVEHIDSRVRLGILAPGEKTRNVTLRAVSSAEAAKIAGILPNSKSATFVPLLAERAAFESALPLVTPQAPVTPALIVINLIMFLIATALGGGLFNVNPEVMIRLGTDFTPLTLGGQWWRLVTSIFLHFGFFHVALNMWALYVNGRVAERIFGNLPFLFIYLVAGVSGSVTSLLWHPFVNGAGASGAIFGVLGALLAFFARRDRGIPASVIKAQLTSTGIFVAYSLLNAARFQGIDNAAHIGGLISGFVMGFILARPLDADRNTKPWTVQWASAIGLTSAAAAAIGYFLATGTLAPRSAHDINGRPVPLAALIPIQTLGGFKLGMSSEDILKTKGSPIKRYDSFWVFNSIDSSHDGVLTVFFSPGSQREIGLARAIEFTGHDQTSAPPEMPYLNSLKPSDVIFKYGEPIRRTDTEGTAFLWFRNGVYIGAWGDKVYRYGIFDLAALR